MNINKQTDKQFLLDFIQANFPDNFHYDYTFEVPRPNQITYLPTNNGRSSGIISSISETISFQLNVSFNKEYRY